jgi:hypothetical protein
MVRGKGFVIGLAVFAPIGKSFGMAERAPLCRFLALEANRGDFGASLFNSYVGEYFDSYFCPVIPMPTCPIGFYDVHRMRGFRPWARKKRPRFGSQLTLRPTHEGECEAPAIQPGAVDPMQ